MKVNKYDLCVLAHVTKDVITTPDNVRKMPGGTGYYFSVALGNMATKGLLITKMATEDFIMTKQLNGFEVVNIKSACSHHYENIYRDYSDQREQKVHSLAEPFKVSDIPSVECDFIHLGPLSKYDIGLDVIEYASTKAKVSLDVQGYLREIINHRVVPCPWEDWKEGLSMINVLKANEFEATTLTGKDNLKQAAIEIAALGVDEVVITLGSSGSLILHDNIFTEIPAFKPQKVVDATGCGDTYMAGYLFKRINHCTISEAGHYAAAMATLKIENFSPFSKSDKEVKHLLSNPITANF